MFLQKDRARISSYDWTGHFAIHVLNIMTTVLLNAIFCFRKFCLFRSMPAYHTTVFILFTTSIHPQCSGGHAILGIILD